MTREEAKKILERIVDTSNELTHPVILNPEMEAIKVAIEALKFAEWTAKEIFSEDMDNAFAELACRRLKKLGVVKADGNKWVLKVGEKE